MPAPAVERRDSDPQDAQAEGTDRRGCVWSACCSCSRPRWHRRRRIRPRRSSGRCIGLPVLVALAIERLVRTSHVSAPMSP